MGTRVSTGTRHFRPGMGQRFSSAGLTDLSVKLPLPPAFHGPCTFGKRINEIPCCEFSGGGPCNLVTCALNFSDIATFSYKILVFLA